MTAESGTEKRDIAPSDDAGALRSAVAAFAERARAAGAAAAEKAADGAARLKADAAAHPIETVTGAFGLGYLVGKALFGRKR